MSLFRRNRKDSDGSKKKTLRRNTVTSTGKTFVVPKDADGKIMITRGSGKPPTAVPLVNDQERLEDTVSPMVLESLDPQERKRQLVIFELIQTEGQYLRDLSVIKNLFRQSIRDAKCISDDDVFRIFSNLDDVIETSSQLYERLCNRRQQGLVGRIADIFVDMFENGGFDSYVTFCANQLPASELYSSTMQKNPEFYQVIESCNKRTEETKGFDLLAFLLKGMQRLLKYLPLLQQIEKRTNPQAIDDLEELNRAMAAVESHGSVVNEAVRKSENTRRLPIIKSLLVRETTSIKWVKPQFDLDITNDPDRKLVYEGRMKFVRPQNVLNSGTELRTMDMYVILLSDMILLTTEREGKFIVKEGKDLTPIIGIGSITDITTELTISSRERTTLCIELARREQQYDTSLVSLDGPRPVLPTEARTYVRFVAPAQGQLQTWMGHLRKSRKEYSERAHELVRTASQTEGAGSEEYAVTMLVSRIEKVLEQEVDKTAGTPDWEISWSASPSKTSTREEVTTLSTRSVRLVQGPDGLGFTLIGRNPVEFQEVDVGGSAHGAGVRQGDQIRAVDGVECTNSSHNEVVGLIRDALSQPKKAVWVPVESPIEEISEFDAQSYNSLGRSARSMRKALLTDPAELELA